MGSRHQGSIGIIQEQREGTVMRIIYRLARVAASRLDNDDKARLVRELHASTMKGILRPMVSPSEFGARNHFDHACSLTDFFEHLENACEEGHWLTPGCNTGCERFMESLRHGGCIDCCRDEYVPPNGLTVTPEGWADIKPHIQYAKCLLDLLMTEAEAMYAFGDGENPFGGEGDKAA